MRHFDTSWEMKFLPDAGTFEGYASVFDVTDSVNDRIVRGAFARSLDGWRRQGRMPPMLWQHDMKEPIGAWETCAEDRRGLYVTGRLFVGDIPRAREAYRLLKEKVVTGLSIGYRAEESHRDVKSGARVLTEIDLIEISMVTCPANDLARVQQVKSVLRQGVVPSPKEFEAFLREAGMSRKQAKGLLTLGYRSLAPREAEPDQDDAAALEAFAEKLWLLSGRRPS